MNKLRWVMDGSSIWEVDISTPATLDGVARPVTHEEGPLPLGLSRGIRLSRPKQLDFFHKFMASPFLPSFSRSNGFSIHRGITLPFTNDWFTSLLGSFDLQKFVSTVKNAQPSDSSLLEVIRRNLSDKSFYAFGFCSEFLVTSNDTLLVGYESREDLKASRKKAVFHHKFPNHNLTVEAISPGLFVDNHGKYWNVPISMGADLASVSSDSGASYHVCLQHISGLAKPIEGNDPSEVPTSLLSGLCLKSAFSFKRNIDFWRSHAKKRRLVQPYDILLSNPHVSASAVIGAVGTALITNNASRLKVDAEHEGFRRFHLYASRAKSSILGDLFANLSFTAQYGKFQSRFFDLSRVHLRLDVPSGSKFLSAAACVAQNMYSSKQPPIQAVQAMCPNATISLQQQLAGPFSLRVDSGISVDLSKQDWNVNLENPVFAFEYALQVLASAKAIAWYAPKQKEFMVELRFFER